MREKPLAFGALILCLLAAAALTQELPNERLIIGTWDWSCKSHEPDVMRRGEGYIGDFRFTFTEEGDVLSQNILVGKYKYLKKSGNSYVYLFYPNRSKPWEDLFYYHYENQENIFVFYVKFYSDRVTVNAGPDNWVWCECSRIH